MAGSHQIAYWFQRLGSLKGAALLCSSQSQTAGLVIHKSLLRVWGEREWSPLGHELAMPIDHLTAAANILDAQAYVGIRTFAGDIEYSKKHSTLLYSLEKHSTLLYSLEKKSCFTLLYST